MEKMFKSELALLRYVASRQKGCTVEDAATKLKTTRQNAYARLERGVEKGLLSYRFEDGKGPQQLAVYSVTDAGRDALAKKWVKHPKRARLVVPA